MKEKVNKGIIVGIGYAGNQFANVISKEESVAEKIDLRAIVDNDLDALLKYKENHPQGEAELFLLVSEEELDNLEEVEGITFITSIAKVVKDEEIDTLINATNNPSHVPVLQDALNACDNSGRGWRRCL